MLIRTNVPIPEVTLYERFVPEAFSQAIPSDPSKQSIFLKRRADAKNGEAIVHDWHRPHRSIAASPPPAIRQTLNRNLSASVSESTRDTLSETAAITTPMKHNCRVALCVPVFDEPFSPHGEGQRDAEDEGVGITQLLFSLAEQKDIKPKEFEVIFLVNNSEADARAQTPAFLRNQETFETLSALSRGIIPSHFCEKTKADCQKILNAKIRIFVIDRFSPGHAFRWSSVGIARDALGLEALRRFEKTGRSDGIIAWTDADSLLSDDYLASLIREYQKNSKLTGCGSRPSFHPARENEMDLLLFAASLASHHAEELCQKIWCYQKGGAGIPNQPTAFMGGSNLSARAKAFKAAGGIPHLRAAEDIVFSKRLLEQGPIGKSPGVVHTPLRVSLRTDSAGGLGQSMARLTNAIQEEKAILRSPRAHLAEWNVIASIESGLSHAQMLQQHPELSGVVSEETYSWLLFFAPAFWDGAHQAQGAFNFELIWRNNLNSEIEKKWPAQNEDGFYAEITTVLDSLLTPDAKKSFAAKVAKRLHTHRQIRVGLEKFIEILGPIFLEIYTRHGGNIDTGATPDEDALSIIEREVLAQVRKKLTETTGRDSIPQKSLEAALSIVKNNVYQSFVILFVYWFDLNQNTSAVADRLAVALLNLDLLSDRHASVLAWQMAQALNQTLPKHLS